MLETWGKNQPPLKFTTVPPQVMVAKFGTTFISSKLYMLEIWSKKQTPV